MPYYALVFLVVGLIAGALNLALMKWADQWYQKSAPKATPEPVGKKSQ